MDNLSNFLSSLNLAISKSNRSVIVRGTKSIFRLLDLLELEGYIRGYRRCVGGKVEIFFRYINGRPSFFCIERVSRRGKKIFYGKKNREVDLSRGIYVVSTSEGLRLGGSVCPEDYSGELLLKLLV